MSVFKKIYTLFYQTLYFFFCLQVAAPQVMAQLLYASRAGFPDSLEGAEFVEYHPGGGGGICVFTLNGQRYIVKGAANEDYIKREALANILYQEAGALVPEIALYSNLGTLPEGHAFRQHLPVTASLFMVAEFIEGENLAGTPNQEGALVQIRRHILTDMLFSNWDMHADNVRCNAEGQAVRVDNGGSLDMHATGGKKTLPIRLSLNELFLFFFFGARDIVNFLVSDTRLVSSKA